MMSAKERRRAQRGFTLLEVMVALAIMAVLSLITTQAIRSGIANRTLVVSEISREAKLSDSLRIMRNDIAQAFHYQDVYCKMTNDAMAPPSPTPGPSAPPGAVIPPPGFPPSAGAVAGPSPKPCPPDVTGFIGSADSLYFTSLSNVRTIRDSQESDQAKIGYFVKSCRNSGLTNAGVQIKPGASKCLYRASSPILDGELEKPGPETLLLEDVEEFKLRYLGPGQIDYVTIWKTGKNGDDNTKDKFPYAVEITLTVHNKNDPKDRPATQTILAPLAFENNPAKKKEQGTPGEGGNNPQGGQSTPIPPKK